MEACPACTADAKSLGARIATLCSSSKRRKSIKSIARERRQRADVPLRRDVNDNRSPKKKMRLGCPDILRRMESPSIDLGTSRMLSARSTI